MQTSLHGYVKSLSRWLNQISGRLRYFLRAGVPADSVPNPANARESHQGWSTLGLIKKPEDVGHKLGHYVVKRLIDYIVSDARNLYIDLLKMCRKGDEKSYEELERLEYSIGKFFPSLLEKLTAELAKRFANKLLVEELINKFGGKECIDLIKKPPEELGQLLLIDKSFYSSFKRYCIEYPVQTYIKSVYKLLKPSEVIKVGKSKEC